MKRYTLKFKLLNPEITMDALKAEVEKILLRLHPRITFKIGQVITTESGIILVQFTAQGNMHLLETHLRDMRWKQPVEFVSLGWGWLVDSTDITPGEGEGFVITSDPLALVTPVEGLVEVRFSKNKLLGRYLFLIIFTLVMILLLIANAIHNDSPLLQWIYVLGFIVWLFSLNDVPFNPRLYSQKIICGLNSLEIYYWWQRKPVQIDWERIWGLDYSEPVCKLYGDDGVKRFVLSERYGCKEKPAVLKTIIYRAGLNYVGGNIRATVYKRYEQKVE